jgi:hypothetical protein
MSGTQNLPRAVAAMRYRMREQLEGGVVILNQGIATGWMDELRDPHAWNPGVVAVDESGKEWIALGGDHVKGALIWRQLNG